MRTHHCEICGKMIGIVNRTMATEFPMIYSGEIQVIGDLCVGCDKIVKSRVAEVIKQIKREVTA